jgi:hypothetical protein
MDKPAGLREVWINAVGQPSDLRDLGVWQSSERAPHDGLRAASGSNGKPARPCAIFEPDETELVPPFLWTARLDAPRGFLSSAVEPAPVKAVSRPPHSISIRAPPAKQ